MSKNNLSFLKLFRSLTRVSFTISGIKEDWGLYKESIAGRLVKAKDLDEEKKEGIKIALGALDTIWREFYEPFYFLDNEDLEQSDKLRALQRIDFQKSRQSLGKFEEELKALQSLMDDHMPSSLLTRIVGRIKETILKLYNIFIAGPIITEGHVFFEAVIPKKKTDVTRYSELVQAVGFLSSSLPQGLVAERLGDRDGNIPAKNS